MRSDDVCVIVALDVKMLPLFDLLLCTNHAHILVHRDYWYKGKSLEHGWRCIAAAAAVLLLCTDLCESTHSTHAYLVHT